jgi:hypothetical protein
MITSDTIQAFRTDYKKYVQPFTSEAYESDNAVVRNLLHTEKVTQNILLIANSLELSESERYTAEALAIFHDIGRFWLLHPDQHETKKMDHAEASVEYLKSNQNFNLLDEQSKNIILEVILYHHTPEIVKKDNPVSLFFSRLLRDADKLDIWRLTVDSLADKTKRSNLAREFGLIEKPIITASFSQNIIDGVLAKKDDIVTFSDYLLFQMSWVFDLNFRKSFQILNKMQYMRHIYDALPKADMVFEIYRKIKIHIENQIL